jgi:hypothetical protein
MANAPQSSDKAVFVLVEYLFDLDDLEQYSPTSWRIAGGKSTLPAFHSASVLRMRGKVQPEQGRKSSAPKRGHCPGVEPLQGRMQCSSGDEGRGHFPDTVPVAMSAGLWEPKRRKNCGISSERCFEWGNRQ